MTARTLDRAGCNDLINTRGDYVSFFVSIHQALSASAASKVLTGRIDVITEFVISK